MDDDTKKKLEDAVKKYSLPKLEDLDQEFDIGSVEISSLSVVRAIRQKMSERINYFVALLDELLYHPEPSHMYESRVFSDKDREKISQLHRRLHYLKRASLECGILREDSKDAEYINSLHKDWPQLKEDLLMIATKLKSSWEVQLEKKDDVHYFA